MGASSVAQLDETLKATDVTLEADDLTALDEATNPSLRIRTGSPHVWWTPRSTRLSACRSLCLRYAEPLKWKVQRLSAK